MTLDLLLAITIMSSVLLYLHFILSLPIFCQIGNHMTENKACAKIEDPSYDLRSPWRSKSQGFPWNCPLLLPRMVHYGDDMSLPLMSPECYMDYTRRKVIVPSSLQDARRLWTSVTLNFVCWTLLLCFCLRPSPPLCPHSMLDCMHTVKLVHLLRSNSRLSHLSDKFKDSQLIGS